MAGLDNLMLHLIKALAENRIQDAKDAAIACCVNDRTKKNEHQVQYYKKLLENGSTKMFELPANLKGLLNMIDISDFNEDRYYLGKQQTELFLKIQKGVKITTKLLEYGIPYTNSTLINGEPGTGKTEFAKYTAYKLGLPYAYINFSYIIDSYIGNTAKNIQRIFDYCKGQKCVLMLDEIDCIGLARSNDTGADGELARTTISLMQALDQLVDGQIVIAATNRSDRLDKALIRRFQNYVEFDRYNEPEAEEMIRTYINSVNPEFMSDDLMKYAKTRPTQADIIKYLIEHIANRICADEDFL